MPLTTHPAANNKWKVCYLHADGRTVELGTERDPMHQPGHAVERQGHWFELMYRAADQRRLVYRERAA
jgi:hypothetical protein